MTSFVLISPDDLKAIVFQAVKDSMTGTTPQAATPEPPIKGIHALAKFLGVSAVTAQKLKNDGKIPYFQSGRLVLFDAVEVRKLMNKLTKNQ